MVDAYQNSYVCDHDPMVMERYAFRLYDLFGPELFEDNGDLRGVYLDNRMIPRVQVQQEDESDSSDSEESSEEEMKEGERLLRDSLNQRPIETSPMRAHKLGEDSDDMSFESAGSAEIVEE